MNSQSKRPAENIRRALSSCDACAARREYIRRLFARARSALGKFARVTFRSRVAGRRVN